MAQKVRRSGYVGCYWCACELEQACPDRDSSRQNEGIFFGRVYAGNSVVVKELTIGQILRLHATVLGVMLATAMPAFATTALNVPEMDGASLSAGLGLLAGGVLRFRSRRRSK